MVIAVVGSPFPTRPGWVFRTLIPQLVTAMGHLHKRLQQKRWWQSVIEKWICRKQCWESAKTAGNIVTILYFNDYSLEYFGLDSSPPVSSHRWRHVVGVVVGLLGRPRGGQPWLYFFLWGIRWDDVVHELRMAYNATMDLTPFDEYIYIDIHRYYIDTTSQLIWYTIDFTFTLI